MAYLKGLLIPAQFAEAAPARPESREIATTRDGRVAFLAGAVAAGLP